MSCQHDTTIKQKFNMPPRLNFKDELIVWDPIGIGFNITTNKLVNFLPK